METGTLGIRSLLRILGCFCLWILADAQMKIPPETVQQWASVFSVQLRDLSTKFSGSLLLQKKLKDVESIIKITELNGDDLLRDYSEEIERMLGSKMKSVKRLAESAEDADLYHEYNSSLQALPPRSFLTTSTSSPEIREPNPESPGPAFSMEGMLVGLGSFLKYSTHRPTMSQVKVTAHLPHHKQCCAVLLPLLRRQMMEQNHLRDVRKSFSMASPTPTPEFLPQQPPKPYVALTTGQKGPIGLLLQLDSIPYRKCLPTGLRVVTATGTDNLATTAQTGCLENGDTEHDPFRLNVPLLPWNVFNVLPEMGVKALSHRRFCQRYPADLPGLPGLTEHLPPLPEPTHHQVVFDYYNSMLINTMDEDGNYVELGGEFPLEENEHFNNLPVNTQQSNIQVPTNVYNKDPKLLNAIYNSEALNDVYVNNFLRDPTLTWQYFGSSYGFFRIYPGIKWTPDNNGVVAFDSRNRNWYIQAATSPKDIIIMVDISGSMKGLKMTIAKHTINTILDTLGENDFVNVIAYTDYVRYVEPCFRGTLVQADLDNREHFKLLVEELHVKGEAKIKNAMKESFKILNEVRMKGQGSMCNQAIMLITDGAMEDYESVFEEFNWPERRVRVFTYLIGREMTFAQKTKWIACNNKGFYTHISTLADVQENVMEYLHVLSRPMVINHDHDIIWTEAYMDTVLFYTKAQSLLLMTSVAMPVFSKKKETLSHGILLGVVGTDVPLMEVMKLAPRYILGPHGYAFLLNNNGYILAHPDLRPLYKDGKKLKPKPNYNSVDLSEVEWEDKEEKLRTPMVKGQTGSMTLNIRASVDKGKRPMYLINNYFYTDIAETPFSFGLVLTKGHGSLMFTGNVSVEEGLHDMTSPDLSIASECFCSTKTDYDLSRCSHPYFATLVSVPAYLINLIRPERVPRKAVSTPGSTLHTMPDFQLNENIFVEIQLFAIPLKPAFTMEPFCNTPQRGMKKFLTPSDKDNLFTIDHFPLWYRLAVENTPGRFLYYAVNDKGVKYVIATTAVTVSSGERMAMAGVDKAGMSSRSVSVPDLAIRGCPRLFIFLWYRAMSEA
ncbi:hypothetical protein CCH79_00017644 [Gambusia affinis]|uniref:VWFA domain-containing protein n=1 Tax=Gambusia affinis TaxID=33528 RepID=A0A315W689_GAMAF|nr:hypothetical protein CCH79_00017644 [Gambusia affinis]